MSRVGKQPIEVPSSVKAHIAGQLLKVEGPKGKLSRELRPEVVVKLEDGKLVLVTAEESTKANAFHGMERALVANMVQGVATGFAKELSLIGTGYRAEELNKGGLKGLTLSLGYSHTIDFPVPQGVTSTIVKEGREVFIRLESADKQLLGQVAAQIRSLRPPEPYKGKGVRYKDEVVKLKAGKSGKK
jgi:large subunit ribosomal protein L6